MNCRETIPLLSLFVDGELDARQMRGVALHTTRCAGCEGELRRIERLQDSIADYINARVDEVDLSDLWTRISPRIGSVPHSWLVRLSDWWETRQTSWVVRAPLYAAAAAAALLAFSLWQSPDRPQPLHPVEVASSADNSVILDSVKSDAEALALLREPETNTLVLWVSDDVLGEAAVDDLGGLP